MSLPEFSFDRLYETSEILDRMGIHSIFDSGAGLTKMFKSKISQHVDKVIHKAKIVINEEGAEASAATVLTFDVISIDEDQPKIFQANHPFLMMIQHKKTNLSLFIGKLYNL